MASGISGSTIKSWFQYRCERKTRYEIMDPEDLAAVPVVKDAREESWAILGIEFEDRVVSRLAKKTGVLQPNIPKEGLPERMALAFLKGLGSAEYAAQVNLRPRRTDRVLGAGSELRLRHSFADLIRRDLSGPEPVFTVIDIKATRSARPFHKTQVAYYVRLLRAVLDEIGAAGKVADHGEIWHIAEGSDVTGSDHDVDPFLLAPYLRQVEDFCLNTLPAVASKVVAAGKDETFFHVYFKCEQCAYLPHCQQWVSPDRPPERRDISAVAGLSHEAKRTLTGVGIRTVASLAEASPGIAKMDGAGWSLSRRADTLINRAKALREGAIGRGVDPHSFLMPPRADVALYLIADNDPVDDGLTTLGYAYVEGGVAREIIEVLPTSDRQAEADALVRIFAAVVNDLQAVDARNEATEAGGGQGLQAHIFLYETSEAISLQNAVARHLKDPRVRGGLLNMVRLFPPEEIVPEPEFRGMQHLPATAVRSVMEQLFAMPVTVSYDLRQVSQAIAQAHPEVPAYRPESGFERPFSALLSLEVSRALRENRKGYPGVTEIRADVSARLAALRGVTDWLRGQHEARLAAGEGPMLRLNKKPFRLQESFDPLDAGDLDLLRAFELLENRAGMLDTLIRLAQPKATRRDSGRAMGPLTLIDISKRARVVQIRLAARRGEAQDADLSPGGYGIVASDGEPDLILDPRLWRDLACDLRSPRPGDSPGEIRINIFRPTFEAPLFQEVVRRAGQEGWWLDQTFVDLNADKADAFLTFLGAGLAA